ncbi:glucan phosphoethanolaminetransferase (alkaline phosphatase superfamily) [Paenibacillus sp. DS2015]|uniref:hypothetical protein n=1 Tax=Paenibacillus sp. DS2015 TaxID=3373917 RepID=UPI003D191718
MDNLKKELLLNVIVVSPILTLVWAGIATTIEDPTSPTDFGPFLPLVLSFLLLYPFNLFVSFTHYFMASRIHPRVLRVIIFNILGLLVSGLVSYFTTTYYLFYPTYSTFIIFSAISFRHKWLF